MKILKAVRRFSSWICGLFRKKPVYVTRHFWDAQLGREVEAYVPQGVLYPNMRIAEALDDLRRGVKFSRKDRARLETYATPKETTASFGSCVQVGEQVGVGEGVVSGYPGGWNTGSAEASCGGAGNTWTGTLNMTRAQAEYMFGRENLKEIEE
jgi:hypothetical protein